MGRASTSLLQRRLRIGYGRAASILDGLEEAGIIGPSNGAKPREVLVSKEQYANQITSGTAGMPLHKKADATAPDSYLDSEDEGDDGTLAFEPEESEPEESKVEESPSAPVEPKESKPAPLRAFSDDEDEGMFFSK
jgi:hypothetical protein